MLMFFGPSLFYLSLGNNKITGYSKVKNLFIRPININSKSYYAYKLNTIKLFFKQAALYFKLLYSYL